MLQVLLAQKKAGDGLPFIVEVTDAQAFWADVPSKWINACRFWQTAVDCCLPHHEAASVSNWRGLFALRFFLGMAESGFFPLVIYYLTTFYRRGELARRLAIFYAASNIANAFSGLLAFGVFRT